MEPVPVTIMLPLALRCCVALVMVGPAEDVPSVLTSREDVEVVMFLDTSSTDTLVTPSVFTWSEDRLTTGDSLAAGTV